MELNITSVKALVVMGIIFLFAETASSQVKQKDVAKHPDEYVCLPCGQDCDKIIYQKPGTCPHCGMALVKKSSITFKIIQPRDICNYIRKHPRVVLLDVRTREEFERKSRPDYGTLQNAINIPVQELEGRLAEIRPLKNKEIIVYCSHSHRSSTASYILTQNGFTNVTNMAGGMSVMEDKTCKK